MKEKNQRNERNLHYVGEIQWKAIPKRVSLLSIVNKGKKRKERIRCDLIPLSGEETMSERENAFVPTVRE
jgi:hypothetical protein